MLSSLPYISKNVFIEEIEWERENKKKKHERNFQGDKKREQRYVNASMIWEWYKYTRLIRRDNIEEFEFSASAFFLHNSQVQRKFDIHMGRYMYVHTFEKG